MQNANAKAETTAAALLAAENGGTEVIARDSDGAVFVRQDVAERVIERLMAIANLGRKVCGQSNMNCIGAKLMRDVLEDWT